MDSGNLEDGIKGQQQSSSPQTADVNLSQGRRKKKMRTMKQKKGDIKSSKDSEPTEGNANKLGDIRDAKNADDATTTSSNKRRKQKISDTKRSDSPAKFKQGNSVKAESHREGRESRNQSNNAEKVRLVHMLLCSIWKFFGLPKVMTISFFPSDAEGRCVEQGWRSQAEERTTSRVKEEEVTN